MTLDELYQDLPEDYEYPWQYFNNQQSIPIRRHPEEMGYCVLARIENNLEVIVN